MVDDEIIKIQGWVRTIRQQKTVAYIQVNDGSNMVGIQGVATLSELNDTSRLALEQITTGAAIELRGKLIQSAGQGQAFELQISYIELIGTCPADLRM